MATFTVNEVLRQLDEDSDSDFEGYILMRMNTWKMRNGRKQKKMVF